MKADMTDDGSGPRTMQHLLFDIDSTMIDTSRSGMRAMLDAGRELYGDGFTTEGIDYAGRLDPLIVHELLERIGVEPSAEAHGAFRRTYRGHLERRLREPGVARALRGVPEVLGKLRSDPGVVLGVLTGNYRETGSMKLAASGIDPAWFRVGVWGDESPHWPARRDHLPPIAIERFGALSARVIDPATVTIIGDTPHDVRCGRVNGCRVLGVATGRFGASELKDAGADLAVEDLSEVDRIVSYLRGGG